MFPTFDIVKELCKKQGISLNTLEENLGFSRNSLYSWKNSSPKPEKLSVVADYFDVSTDYLLGRTSNTKIDVEKLAVTGLCFNGKPLTKEENLAIQNIIEIYLKGR